jgi:hypothetical protein
MQNVTPRAAAKNFNGTSEQITMKAKLHDQLNTAAVVRTNERTNERLNSFRPLPGFTILPIPSRLTGNAKMLRVHPLQIFLSPSK